MNDTIEDKLARLESKPRLDMTEIDYTIARPEVLAERLGAPLRYAQRVESEVTGLSIETLLPRVARSDYVSRFLDVWKPDEQGHSRALSRLLRLLDIEPEPEPLDEPVPFHNRVAGALGRLSVGLHEVVELVYHTIGAMNEKLAFTAYERMAEIMTETGDRGLVETLMKPLRRDESAHLGYYRSVAQQLRQELSPWQIAVARTLIVRTWAPVGAGRPEHKPPFGLTVLALSRDQDHRKNGIVERVQQIAEPLLTSDGRPLPPFVQRAIDECVDSAHAVLVANGQPGRVDARIAV